MTMPNERTRALILAAEFLQKLGQNSETSLELREEAIAILRHSPKVDSIEMDAKRQLNRQRESGTPSWVLPVEAYEETKIA